MKLDYYKIESAIQFLESNYQSQPTLEDLAKNLNTSPFHLQRLFKKWVGISPKRFLQFLTIEHAKKMLAESRSVLDATYDSGLSSPGRLHDLFINIEAMTPGQFKSGGAGINIYYHSFESPFGNYLLAVTDKGICGFYFLTSNQSEVVISFFRKKWKHANLFNDRQRTELYHQQIFSQSTPHSPDPVNLYLKGTNFQIKVWKALLQIPPGHLTSYQQVANIIGEPEAVRAVGNAVGANPISYLIPCHRVIRNMGQFGQYQSGSARKKAIIGWEAAKRFGEQHQII